MYLQAKAPTLCFMTVILTGVSAVYIENNAYKGVTIAFSPSIQGKEVNSSKLKNVIQKASNLLYLATRRRAFFSEVDFLYPSTWTNACAEATTVVGQQPQRISVHVSGSQNKDVKNSLRTQHSKGCGAQGEVIYMSPFWLDGDEEELSRELVRQWAIYRYGVFEETPEPDGWSCYTNDGKHWIQNGCYSTDISVELQLDGNGLPFCNSVDITDYHNLTSSLMSSVSSRSITSFCDGTKLRPHNPTAPTRHNRICKGKPVWRVIKESEDFRYGRNQPRKPDFKIPDVSFRCFQESKSYIIFSIQVASKGNEKEAEEIVNDVRSSLLRFLLFEVWPETQVSIVTFYEVVRARFHLDLTQPEKASEDVDIKVRATLPVLDVCLSCGLKGAFDLSRENEEKNTAVVFMVFASALKSHNLGELIDLLESSPSRTYMIIIQDKEEDFTAPNLIRAMKKTGGEVFMVPKSSPILTTKITIFLSNVLKNPLNVQDKAVIIHRSSFFNINKESFEDPVEADACLEGEMTYSLVCDSSRPDATDITTACSTLPNMKNMETKIRCGFTATLTKETNLRKWTFSFLDKGGVTPVNCSAIATVRLKANSSDLLTVRGWMSTDTIEPDQPGRNALIIYAEVMHNSEPVTNARIQAAVYSSANSTPTMIELLDTGNGDPDMKKGDGIYSRYFTRIYNRGMHSVVLYATGNITDCGPTRVNKDQVKFSRIVPVGSFVVTAQPKYTDYYPPNRIGDLRITSIDNNDSTVTLQWTAPGDNYDDGTANGYNVKFSQTMSDLAETTFETGNSESLENVAQQIQMLPSGKLQTVTIQLPVPAEKRPYYLAVQAVNKNNDVSPVSNIVQIFFTVSAPVRLRTTTVRITSPRISDFTPTSEGNSSEFTNLTSEGITQTIENWENKSSPEPITSTRVFTPTTADEPTGTSTSTSATMDPSTNTIKDSCDMQHVIILASSIGGGILVLFLIINAVVCSICFRKHRKPETLSRKTSLRPPHNMTLVHREGPSVINDHEFLGPRGSLGAVLQDFEVDTDYTFVPGSQRKRGVQNQNHYTSAQTMQAGNVGFTNRSLTRRFNSLQETTFPGQGTSSSRVRYTPDHGEYDPEEGAVSLGLV